MFSSRFDSQIDRVVVGRFPFELSESNVMLAEVLEGAGYFTAAVLPHPYFTPKNWRGLTQGFSLIDSEPARWYATEHPHSAEHVTDHAIAIVKRMKAKPLFLWAHYFDAHPPHRAPLGQSVAGTGKRELYAAEISHLDHQLGRLLAEIRLRDQNFVVIITGDHAIAFDEPRHRQVHYAHDLSTAVLHVPLMVYTPLLPQRRIATLVNSLDLAPTIANVAGVVGKLPFMGHSLLPLMLGEPADLPSLRFAQFYISEDLLRGDDPLRMASARSERYNVVLDRRTGLLQAYDWRLDPEERHDLWHDRARVGQPPDAASNLADSAPGQRPDGAQLAPVQSRPPPTGLLEMKRQLDAFINLTDAKRRTSGPSQPARSGELPVSD